MIVLFLKSIRKREKTWSKKEETRRKKEKKGRKEKTPCFEEEWQEETVGKGSHAESGGSQH